MDGIIQQPKTIIEQVCGATNNNHSNYFENIRLIILKVTNRCNLSCLYCYEPSGELNDMPIGIAKISIEKILSSTKSKKVTIIFHGGEPSLLSDEWFSTIVNYAKERANNFDKQVCFGIQTNGLLINEEKINLFTQLGISISFSMDGPSTIITNPYRKQSDVVVENFHRAQKMGANPNILMVINKSNFLYFKDLCYWIEHDLNLNSFKANVMANIRKGSNITSLTAKEIHKAQLDILDYITNVSKNNLIETNLSRMLYRFFSPCENVHSLPMSICGTATCGAGNSVVSISPSGSIFPCGRFDSTINDFCLGFVTKERLDYQVFDSLTTHKSNHIKQCATCSSSQICEHVCLAFNLRDRKFGTSFCESTQLLFRSLSKRQELFRNFYKLLVGAETNEIINDIKTKLLVSNYSDDRYGDHNDYGDY